VGDLKEPPAKLKAGEVPAPGMDQPARIERRAA
jgi:hypothetical protein